MKHPPSVPQHLNVLQAIAAFATVTNVKRSTRKLVTIYSGESYFSQFLLIQHPHQGVSMFKHVQMLLICVFRWHPSTYSGTPLTAVWVKLCVNLDSTCLRFLPHLGIETSSQSSLQITVFCVVVSLLHQSVTIEQEIPFSTSQRECAHST